MTTTLTDRYVAAAVRTVPERQRADLAAELRASIADQIDARVAAGESDAAAEHAVLLALGDPDRLAAEYTDRPLWLVGPRYYLTWRRLLVLLLWIVLPCAGIGVALGLTISGAPLGEVVGTVAVTLLTVALHLAFWTTLTFAMIERLARRRIADGLDPDDGLTPWAPDQLPEPRDTGAGRSDMIVAVVLLAALAGFVLWDRFIGFAPGHPRLSFLDPDLWPWWITGLFVVLALEAIVAIAVYALGRWTPVLAVANGILNLVVAVPAVWLLVQGRLINPEFWTTLVPADSADTVAQVVAVLTGFGIVLVAAWDAIDAARKTRVRGRI